MKQLIVLVTACSALVIVYFLTTVGFQHAPGSAEAQAQSPSHAAPAAPPKAEPPAPKLTALLPDSPGFYNLQFAIKVGEKSIVLPCRTYIPRDYDKNKELRPLVIFLHGDDERGTDLAAIATVGPEKRLREDQGFRDNFRYISISPQCPPNASWDDPDMAAAVLSLSDEIAKVFRIDPERIHLTGTGMGAAGAWRVAALQPDKFATVAVNSAKANTVDPDAPKLKHIFVSIAAPQNDKATYDVYLSTVEALGKAHADMQPRVNGNNAKECANWFFADGGTWEWLNQHKRRTPQERQEREARFTKELAAAMAAIPKVAGEYKLNFSTWIADKKVDFAYTLVLPRGYETSPTPSPTILFLCGAGELNPDLSGIASFGPVALMHADPKFKDWCPFICISPLHDNSPERARAIVELIDFLEKTTRIDPDRVFITGLSLGGTSTWTVANAGPDRFAAIVPINGRERCIDVAAQNLKYIKTWIIVGGADGDFFTGSVHMNQILQAAGNDVHLTVIPGEGHGSWPRYYTDRRFWEWMLQQKRLSPEARAERDKFPATAPSQMLAHADQHPQVLRPGHHWLEFATQLAGKPFNLRYSLYLPQGYNAANPNPADRWPLMVTLHNDEQRMTDQSMIFDYGNDVDPRLDEKSRPPFPMIGFAPQLPENRQWNEPEIVKITTSLLDEIAQRLRVDPDRVYLTGVQNGGSGAWSLALAAPERFAAVFPFQGGAVNPDDTAKRLKHVAAKVIAPQQDGNAVNAARQMVDALRKTRSEVRLALVPPPDQSQWTPYYTDPELVGWLLRHRRLSPQERKERDDRDARDLATPTPQKPGSYANTFTTSVDGKPLAFSYRLTLPKTYDKNQDRLPLLLFLHGANMPATQPSQGQWGPDLEMQSNPKLADPYPLIAIAPQCPAGRRWEEPAIASALVALVDDVATKYRVDLERIYCGGVDVGGTGAWRVAMEAPDRFAAVFPAGGTLDATALGERLRGVPAWMVASDGPPTDQARQLAAAFQKLGTETQLITLPHPDAKAWQSALADPKIFDWLLRHRRAR